MPHHACIIIVYTGAATLRYSTNPAYDLPGREAAVSGSDGGSDHLYDIIDNSPDVVHEMDTNPSYVHVS